jgi:FkbM family methyltransferase
MNFSSIPQESTIGKLLRLPLKLLPGSMVLPILQGPLKGMRWIVGSGDHGYWLGSYELVFQKVFAANIQPGDIVLDIGAHVGFYTLLAARQVGKQGHVHAFEPLPRNAEFIQRHIQINQLKNVSFRPLAISVSSGSVRFGGGISSSTGRITSTGDLEVESAALDDLLCNGVISPPSVMKIDVEGAEAAVLRGGKRLLEMHQPVIFLATHGPEAHQESTRYLLTLGYKLEPINAPSVKEASEIQAFK